jgi:hypothetical protein
MTTVLFIHGTGARRPALDKRMRQINAGLARVRPGLSAELCYWGEHGAELLAGGTSFYFDQAGIENANLDVELDEEDEADLWAQLMSDPLYEVRIRQFVPPPEGDFGPTLAERMQDLPGTPGLAAELAELGLDGAFADAVTAVTGAPEFSAAFDRSTTTDGKTESMLARALVAYCLAASAADGVWLSADTRSRLLAAVSLAFGVPDQGLEDLTDGLKRWAKHTAYWGWAVHPVLRNRRREEVGQLADIVYYQARGREIREFVRKEIRNHPGPVVLLTHSLGGIIAFDLLAGDDTSGLEQVKLLVTVGSQVPLLYELNALACGLKYPGVLPASFTPRWVNIYDRRDLLAYAGDTLFYRRCRDIPVSTGTAFPAAHEAYWDTRDVYRHVAEAMRKANL